jgi:hypothetical protein
MKSFSEKSFYFLPTKFSRSESISTKNKNRYAPRIEQSVEKYPFSFGYPIPGMFNGM